MRENKFVVGFDYRCLDGTLAAYLLERLFPWRQINKGLPRSKAFDGFIYVGLTNPLFKFQLDKLRAEASRDKELFIVDFSIPPQEAIDLASRYKHVTICDHHVSGTEKYEKYRKYLKSIGRDYPDNLTLLFENGMCGAEIVFEKILKERFGITIERPALLDYVRMADLGLVKTPYYGPIVSYIDTCIDCTSLQGPSGAFRKMDCFNTISPGEIVQYGRVLHPLYLSEAKRILAAADYTALDLPGIGPAWVPFIHTDVRDCGGRFVADEACKAGGVVLLWWERDGIINVSVRTNGTPSAREIAEFLGLFGLGGGGHPMRSCSQYMPDRAFPDDALHSFRHIFPLIGRDDKRLLLPKPPEDLIVIRPGAHEIIVPREFRDQKSWQSSSFSRTHALVELTF